MKDNQFNKLVVVSSCDSFSKSLGQMLSHSLDMIFCDTQELIEYELVDINAIEVFCSKDYLEQCEKKVVKHLSTFENVVVSISCDYLIHNYDLLKNNSLIVFLQLPKKFVKENSNVVDFLSLENREKSLQEIAQICVKIKKMDLQFVCDKVIQKLGSLI